MRTIIFSLLLLFACNLGAQTLNETYDLAKQLYEEERYQEARKVFQRIAYFDKAGLYPQARLILGDLLMFEGNSDDALVAYKRAIIASETLNLPAIQGKCRALVSLNRPQEALLEIYQIDTLSSPEAPSVYHFLMGTTMYAMDDGSAATKHFSQLFKGDSLKLQKLDELMLSWKKADDINPTGRRILSYILPGLGQASVGEFGEATNSLLVNAGFYYLFFTTLKATAWLDAILLAYPWFNRYYHGGASRAFRLAKSKKARDKSEIYNRILDLIN